MARQSRSARSRTERQGEPVDTGSMDDKLRRLEELLSSWGSVAVGYSGGVDSTFLAAVCARVLPGRAMLVRLDTPFAGTPERASAEGMARDDLDDKAGAGAGESLASTAFGLPLLTIAFDPFQDAGVVRNDANRCYWCKRAGFSAIVEAARRRGCAVVVDGSNADDAGDYRPGMRAIEELGVRSPLMETGWHKDEERALLRSWGYAVWDMPAGACLATRVPCGEALSPQKLAAVRACEDRLHELGLRQVRARLVGGGVRIEASEEDARRLEDMGAVAGVLPAAMASDLAERAGLRVEPKVALYRKGSMNAAS